ncbi:glyceraldehyde 3-phosphate dehydrogenase NAD-binding domain-containing protein [Congregibacter litoralis]|uniref:Glyceraldehyde-3-phosphate dehydrogenase/erythrose-4-phosphate dehydrogenase n=1 Tax=Congregibacter litoralis KT71 TaxID=314285 RepID=A4AD74_9GAMM|nr:Glyceraldehyde-3-phosphate dehydrogenase/erythrose-4-phosphate dehydrogenase [Congregibacter litoralis KT71]
MLRIAINGYGRIGRNILRALVERGDELADALEIVAINDLGDSAINAHLTQYDSVHGRFPAAVTVDGDYLLVGKKRIRVLSERDPSRLPWKALNVDVVCECTGVFTARDKAAQHLAAGARKVLVSAPSADADATIVYGINHHKLTGTERVVSNASCTTNCLAPWCNRSTRPWALPRDTSPPSTLTPTISSFRMCITATCTAPGRPHSP